MFEQVQWRLWRAIDRLGLRCAASLVLVVLGGVLSLFSLALRLPLAQEIEERTARNVLAADAAEQELHTLPSASRAASIHNLLKPPADALAEQITRAAQSTGAKLTELSFESRQLVGADRATHVSVRARGAYAELKRFAALVNSADSRIALIEMRFAPREGEAPRLDGNFVFALIDG